MLTLNYNYYYFVKTCNCMSLVVKIGHGGGWYEVKGYNYATFLMIVNHEQRWHFCSPFVKALAKQIKKLKKCVNLHGQETKKYGIRY